jgi:hypothetical protein
VSTADKSTADKTTAATTPTATDEHTQTGTADDTRRPPHPSPADPRDLLDDEDLDLLDELHEMPVEMPAADRRNRHARAGAAAPDHPGRDRSDPRPPTAGPDVDERFLVGDYLVVDRAVTDADNVDSTRNDDVAIVVDGTVLWSEDLDPANAVDRVGLEATVGLGSAARAERVEARLDDPQTSPAAGAEASTATTPRAITAGPSSAGRS